MMELAINYSPQAAGLVEAGAIRIDRFKVPDWPELIATAARVRPVYVHFALNAGADDSKTTDWAAADRMARETDTPYVNLHLAPRAKDFGTAGASESERDGASPVTERLIADVARAVEFFGRDRVIVENVPIGNPDENFARAAVEPAAIRRVIEATGAGFLLDLSHARLTAKHLGLDERTYVSALPVDHLRELHLTGLGVIDGRWRDHLEFRDADWEITAWAIERIRRREWGRPKIVALEYGGVGEKFTWRTDVRAIEAQVPRLYEMVHG